LFFPQQGQERELRAEPLTRLLYRSQFVLSSGISLAGQEWRSCGSATIACSIIVSTAAWALLISNSLARCSSQSCSSFCCAAQSIH